MRFVRAAEYGMYVYSRCGGRHLQKYGRTVPVLEHELHGGVGLLCRQRGWQR